MNDPAQATVPLKLEHEQILEAVLPELQRLVDLVPKSHHEKTAAMARSILEKLHRANMPTSVVAPVLAMALEQILEAILQRSRGLRAQGYTNPSDPKAD